MEVEKLLIKLYDVEKNMKQKPRVLKADSEGVLLLDPTNQNDVEWFENDDDYDVFEQAKATLEIEGFQLTADDEKAIKSVTNGLKTREELIQELKKEGENE